ncbi:MAG: Uma2 family endonuclease [Nostoc sp.]|uniref:Uma2 family endonuclease n=1 Tax=Nostoc sp. TaxID=1180 RepID=UPI002FF91846
MSLTIKDLEQLQSQNPDFRMELVEGNIIVMGLSDYESDEIGSRLLTFLNIWVMPRKLGRVTGSSAGFILPSIETDETGGDPEKRNLRAPDVSFVRAERLKKTQRDFVQLVPDLMVEVKSKSESPSPKGDATRTDTLRERLKPLQEKIKLFLQLGSTVGILIDPDKLLVTVYRSNLEPVVLKDNNKLTIPELLPGWELAITELWPPEFE